MIAKQQCNENRKQFGVTSLRRVSWWWDGEGGREVRAGREARGSRQVRWKNALYLQNTCIITRAAQDWRRPVSLARMAPNRRWCPGECRR